MKDRIAVPGGQGPELKPGPQFAPNTLEMHSCKGLAIILPRTTISLPRARHYHDSYEFLLPYEMMEHCCVDDEIVTLPEYRLMPFNPNQFHGASEPGEARFLSIMLARYPVEQIAASFGFRSSVEFCNESIMVNPRFHSLINTMVCESKGQQMGYQAILESIAAELTVYLMRNLAGNLDPYRFGRKLPGHSKIQRALQYIEENFDQEFSLDELAVLANVSTYHLIRLFKQQTGMTPHSYITRFRVTRAQEMLLRKDLSVTDVCFSSGFTNPSHFSTVFRSITGMAPSEYREAALR